MNTSELPRPFLVGMVQLPALPASPQHRDSMHSIIERALSDARSLADAGFDAVIIENYGDVPFQSHRVDPATVAGMTVVAKCVKESAPLKIGINVLRNDARAALAVAAISGADFIRVNVHTGVAATDQGVIEGRSAETLRYRRRIESDVAIFADVHVKHAHPISHPDIVIAARETAYRGLADGLIVSGPATGMPPDERDVARVREAVPDRLILIGSGSTAKNVRSLLQSADGVIVGTSMKRDGSTSAPVDADRAKRFIEAARAP